MSEDNNLSSYEAIHQENLRKDEQEKQLMESIRLQTVQRLRTDPAIQEYFKNFSPASVESFVNGYAHKKTLYIQYADMYENIAEKAYTRYMEWAEHCLMEIQRKKLYDLRCQWGAELIALEGVECSYDFLTWNHDILNCSAISPISQEDFDLYMDYANSEHFKYTKFFIWMAVSHIRTNVQEDDWPKEYPAWFIYHNHSTDAGYYAMLPDTRYEKELFYLQLVARQEKAETEKKYETGELQRPASNEPLPVISDNEYDTVAEFIRLFEDRELLSKFEKFEHYANPLTNGKKNGEPGDKWLDERVDEIIRDLRIMKDIQLPVNACADWRHGLIVAWNKFEKEEIVKNLPAAYDNYLFRLQNGIRFSNDADEDEKIPDLIKTLKAQILAGRVLNNEPPDFNF